jgi:ubiquinone/menaquinone biosynthesis C-methylase UbiE
MRENSDSIIYQQIMGLVNLQNKKVLEIGCGDGRITSLLAKKAQDLTAIDPDEACLARAANAISKVDFQVGKGEALNFPDHFFDLVIFSLSLHHQNSAKALAQAKRVLKDQGKILVLEPVPEGEIEKICEVMDKEAHKKAAAQKAIGKSGLILKHSTMFTAEWRFENLADLWDWLANYYQAQVDGDKKKKIMEILADRPQSPLLVGDLMVAQLLCKSAGEKLR